MCGICGVFDFRGGAVQRDLVRKMSNAIRHRGPDGEGLYVCGQIGFGHRRLSIIDLQGGNQPITNEDDSMAIIFNGEIYNFVELREELEKNGHVFKTRSDTEVILHGYEEWGIDCLNHFNGIFAFAIWDQKQKRLFIARDHIGVKPLYYMVAGNRLLFASEIKALLQGRQMSKGGRSFRIGAIIYAPLRSFAQHLVSWDQEAPARALHAGDSRRCGRAEILEMETSHSRSLG